MDEDIVEKAEIYAARRDRRLAGRLGFGIHGVVFAIEGNLHPGVAALKVHHSTSLTFASATSIGRWRRTALLAFSIFAYRS